MGKTLFSLQTQCTCGIFCMSRQERKNFRLVCILACISCKTIKTRVNFSWMVQRSPETRKFAATNYGVATIGCNKKCRDVSQVVHSQANDQTFTPCGTISKNLLGKVLFALRSNSFIENGHEISYFFLLRLYRWTKSSGPQALQALI